MSDDEVARNLIKRTVFTESQLDTLLIDKINRQLSLDQKRILRDSGKVSKGSFARTLKQAENNFEKSLYTVIILEYFSMLQQNDIMNLLRVGALLNQAKLQKIPEDKVKVIIGTLSVTIEKISKSKSDIDAINESDSVEEAEKD
ncbi:MAG: hypothetical protein M1503_08645 [Thaumarchaeota archaeon]|nr:hypothetical protein [Nitrososphaerota archaeon]MCL5318308.1 hypothetical protein [Nitrososphaerota archaeon]